jgi:phosphotransferase system enzyme I (PtsP)
MAMSQKRRAEFAALRDLPPVTKDGVRDHVMVNAGLRDDAARWTLTGADGIGLFRTEFQFLVSATLPGRESQQRLYRKVLDAAGDKPVVFRTSTSAATRPCPICDGDESDEENPAMGWRALRLALDRDADEGAGAGADRSGGRARARVMFPMVSEPWEFEEARACSRSSEWLARRASARPARSNYGAMLEVPALAEMLDILLPRGRLPVDRHQRPHPVPVRRRPRRPALAERYDWLSPAILRFLRRVVREAAARRRAGRRLRRDGRAAAGGDGADRDRHRALSRSRRRRSGRSRR